MKSELQMKMKVMRIRADSCTRRTNLVVIIRVIEDEVEDLLEEEDVVEQTETETCQE